MKVLSDDFGLPDCFSVGCSFLPQLSFSIAFSSFLSGRVIPSFETLKIRALLREPKRTD